MELRLFSLETGIPTNDALQGFAVYKCALIDKALVIHLFNLFDPIAFAKPLRVGQPQPVPAPTYPDLVR